MSFVLISVIWVVVFKVIDADIEPDCPCITGWTEIDLDCDIAISEGVIELLEDYLTLPTINCKNNCDTNYECQQALSLLTQYYDFCPLGTIDDKLIREYWQYSQCTDCKQVPPYYNAINQKCNTINNCSLISLISIENSIDYFITDCIDIDNNNNDTFSITCDHDLCNNNLFNITSYLRQCRNNLLDDTLFNDNYDLLNNNCVQNNFDCNIPQIYDHSGYNMDCASNLNLNYTAKLQTNNKLDLNSIKQQTMLCFYGLNIENPTNYDLICIEKQELIPSGIISYKPISAAVNTNFWSYFGIAEDMDMLWVLLCGALVFFMQTGFTLLEAGSVKTGNVQNILFKNIMDACIGAITFFIVGYCVAYGNPDSDNANGFIGVENILIESNDFNSWFFQWAFAATAATIVSGAVAERCTVESYFIYTVVISSWIYPIVVHWTWSENGWISPFNNKPNVFGGAIDFAGSAVVHMVGGFCGFMGAFWLGPRLRRFDRSESTITSVYYDELRHQFEFGHNVPYQVLGTLILWFGWYGFNCGSTLAANGAMELASKVAVTTTLSAAAGGITCCVLAKLIQKSWHIPRLCNGILAALVSITASCSVVSPGVAIVIGIVGGLVYYAASNLLEKLQIDDPLDAFAVHGCCGMWAILSAGIFGTDENIQYSLYPELLWKDTSHAQRFATQLVLVLSVAAWTSVNACILFGGLSYLRILRVPEQYERSGIDLFEHGGSAVNMKSAYTQVTSTENSKESKQSKPSKQTIDSCHISDVISRPMSQLNEENEKMYPL